MRSIEEQVRDSLRARAQDVEPTPALWNEVDRRIARRRHRTVVSWSLVAAAAVVVAVFVVPGLVTGLGSGEIEIEPIGPGTPDTDPDTDPVPGTDPSVDPDGDTGPGAADDPGTSDDSGGESPSLTEPIVIVSDRELTLLGPDGPTVVASLAEEGESRFLSARVRPGSTVDDLTVVTLTTSEGMYDLREVRYVDGDVVTFAAFEAPYTPLFGGAAGSGASVWGPVWSPDGLYLAWFEYGTGPATLRTVGWDDGPGTGVPATDNASFDLPTGRVTPLTPMEWVEVPDAPGTTEIRATSSDSDEGWYALPVTIQGDGAVSLDGSELLVRPVPDEVTGSVVAIAGASGAEDVNWMVVSRSDGATLLHSPGTSPMLVDLPGALVSGDEIPSYVLREAGEDALVGSPATGVLVLVAPDGGAVELATAVVDVDVVN